MLIFSVSMLFSLLTIQNEAVDKTANTLSANTSSNTNSSSTNTKAKNTTNNTTVSNSSNANLSDLGITPHDFKGFKPGTTSYEVEVPENTKTVNVYAEAQSTNATVTGTGNKTLEKGDNKLEVVATAKDGTKKTYTIHVIRGEKGTRTTEEKEEGLAELKINDNLELSPDFQTNVYEYKLKYIGEDTKLRIETKATNDNYVVEVTGNENLQEGENIITILVSESNGDNVATYQITVNKSLIDEEAIVREAAEKRKQKQMLIIGVVGIVLILIILVSIIKYKRNRDEEERFSRNYFYGNSGEEEEEEDDDEEEEDEVPKALSKKASKKEILYEEEEEEIEKRKKAKEEFLNSFSNKEQEEKSENKQKGKRFKE